MMKSFDTFIFEEYDSLTKFAAALKVSDRTLHRWRMGDVLPTLTNIKEIAKLLKQPEPVIFEMLAKINKKAS